MTTKVKDEKPSTSSIVGCCQSSNTTPENSIVDYIEEDIETSNNNTLFHAPNASGLNTNANLALDILAKKRASIDFTFPKRPKVDIEFQNIKYTVKNFSFKHRQFGKHKWWFYRPVIGCLDHNCSNISSRFSECKIVIKTHVVFGSMNTVVWFSFHLHSILRSSSHHSFIYYERKPRFKRLQVYLINRKLRNT